MWLIFVFRAWKQNIKFIPVFNNIIVVDDDIIYMMMLCDKTLRFLFHNKICFDCAIWKYYSCQ